MENNIENQNQNNQHSDRSSGNLEDKKLDRNQSKSRSRSPRQQNRYPSSQSRSNSDSENSRNNYKYKKYINKKPPIQHKYSSHKSHQEEIRIPMFNEELQTLGQFVKIQKKKIEMKKLEKYYEQYKKDWEEEQKKIFFSQHKGDQWFLDKYDPDLLAAYTKEKIEESQQKSVQFFENLKNNVYKELNFLTDQQKIEEIVESTTIKNNEDNPLKQQYFTLKMQINFTKAPYFGFDPNENTLFIQKIPTNVRRQELYDIFVKIPGFVSLSLSEPQMNSEFIRYGWIQFTNDQTLNKAKEILKDLTLNNFTFIITKSQAFKQKGRIFEKINVKQALPIVKKLIETFDNYKSIANNPLLQDNSTLTEEQQLDLKLLYLRKVHSYCYFCGTSYQDERMLSKKCGVIHLRTTPPPDEEKLNINIPNKQTSINKLAEDTMQELLTQKQNQSQPTNLPEEISNYILKKLDRQKKEWPCKHCQKRFVQDIFLLKHIKTKHEQEFTITQNEAKKEIIEEKIYSNYSHDKYKLTNQAINQDKFKSINQRVNKQKIQKDNQMKWEKQQEFQKKQEEIIKNFEYKDLDDPKNNPVQQVNNNKVNVINYFDI